MNKIRKLIWLSLGFLFLGIAYIGVITPGIPWSTPSLIAAYCFAKSSKRWHDWIMNHKLFGPFIRNWSEKRIYPTKAKWLMFIGMDISLIILWITTGNLKAVIAMAVFFTLILIWASRYPSTEKEWEDRVSSKSKIGWFK